MYAENDNDVPTHRAIVRSLVAILVQGPTPVPEAIVRCEQLYEANRDQRLEGALVANSLSALYAMAGRFEDAGRYARIVDPVVGKADTIFSALMQATVGKARELAGDLAGAEQAQRAKWLFFAGATGGPPDGRAVDAATQIARLCCYTGRWDEVEEWIVRYRGARQNVDPGWLAVEARLAAHRGDLREALDLAGQAVERAEGRENLNSRAEMWLALAEVQRAAGRADEADASVAEALALYEQKGNIAAGAHVRAALSESANLT